MQNANVIYLSTALYVSSAFLKIFFQILLNILHFQFVILPFLIMDDDDLNDLNEAVPPYILGDGEKLVNRSCFSGHISGFP